MSMVDGTATGVIATAIDYAYGDARDERYALGTELIHVARTTKMKKEVARLCYITREEMMGLVDELDKNDMDMVRDIYGE